MSDTLEEVTQHYQMWTEDNERRMTRKHGWNDVTDAYYGKLPNDWPYMSKISIPLIRTSLIEKNGRLINSRLRGKLVPREGGDSVGAIINNSLLEFQHDSANHGGSMLIKTSICDMDTRLYGSKYAYNYWRYECDKDGNVVFDGNEMMPLDLRDCGIEPTASHIRDAKWFQLRRWMKVEDMEAMKDQNGKPMYKNLDKLKKSLSEKINKKSSKRRDEYVPRVKTLQGMEDRVGEDIAYPVCKIVTEFREDKWITFSPDYDLILEEKPNPFEHGKIPINQLRYYPLQDDPNGESEVESVLLIWLAIQAVVCAYLDEVILKIRPPLKIIENAARIETIVYGPEAQWLVDRQDAIEEMQSNNSTLNYFQTTYQSMVAAFNTAMGDLSQGTSAFDPFSKDAKTATEVKATQQQQNVRDQKNQNDLIEFLKDMMMMWQSNNKQFIFSDPKKVEHVVRIVGEDQWGKLERMGLADTEVMPEAMQMVQDIMAQNPNLSDAEIQSLHETASMPKFPVILNPGEKNPEKIKMKAKMTLSETGDIADVSVVPQDLDGTFDYIADVQAMGIGANEMMMQSRQQAIALLTSNPTVLSLLQQEGYRPRVKELLSADLEDKGLRDAERYFEKIENEIIQGQQGGTQQGAPQMGGAGQNMPKQGLPGVPQADPAAGLQQQMAGPQPANPGGQAPVPNV